MILVDSNVVTDIVSDDPSWRVWSLGQLEAAVQAEGAAINDIAYAELAAGYGAIDDLNAALDDLSLIRLSWTDRALFIAGHVFSAYRKRGGPRQSLLPDFIIGAHAQEAGMAIPTRDPRPYRQYFPNVRLITPP